MNVTSKLLGNTLSIAVSGKVDTSNAKEFETQIDEIRAAASYESIQLDCEELEYISSFGLRVILRLRKAEPTLKLIGVSTEVYDIFDMTGFTEMIPIEKGYRRMSVDGCKVIGEGAKGTVYRYDPEIIVKVYKDPDCIPDIRREQDLARRAFVMGVPTALSYDIVKVGDKLGAVFELLDSKSFSELIVENPDKLETYANAYADMLRKIHEIKVEPGTMPSIKPRILRWLTTARNFLPEAAADRVEQLIQEAPDTNNLLHCDYHTSNLLMQGDEPILIDMDTLSLGHPVFELANSYVTYKGFGLDDPSNVETFLGIPCPVAREFWDLFLRRYLQTDDPARLEEVELKSGLVGDLRLLNHVGKREGLTTEVGRRSIEHAVERIVERLPKLDTIAF